MADEPGVWAPALQPNDTIAIISPSFRVNQEFPAALARTTAWLEEQGYRVAVYPDDEPEDFGEQIMRRCEDIHAAFRDPNVKAIVCTLGGAHCNELLPHIDYELIKANPKIFCGFSDITALHLGIFAETRLRTFYGPMAIDPLGGESELLPFTRRNLLRAITGSGRLPPGRMPMAAQWSFSSGVFPDESTTLHSNPGWRWLRKGSASGRVFGGCLEPMMRLPGTKWWPDLRSKILLVETSLGEHPGTGPALENVRAQFATLRILDVFAVIGGLIVGRPYGYSADQRKGFDQIVLNQTRDFDFPILTDIDVGHTSPILTLPLNATAVLDSETNTFEITEPCTR